MFLQFFVLFYFSVLSTFSDVDCGFDASVIKGNHEVSLYNPIRGIDILCQDDTLWKYFINYN